MPHNNLPNYNDKETTKCDLQRKPWLDKVIEEIKNTNAPKTIAINGGWGSGKTSVLKL